MAHDRVVAGLWCREVLARLSDYLDDELAPAERRQVEAHLRGCDWCERFGGEMAQTIEGLRRAMPTAEAAPPGDPTDPAEADLLRLLERLDPPR